MLRDGPENIIKTNVRIELEYFRDIIQIKCIAKSTEPLHNVHLSCPLMAHRCFENCIKICEPTGCQNEPTMLKLNCSLNQYTQPAHRGEIIREFEYLIDKYDRNITGPWFCEHAGVKSEFVELVAFVPIPTTTKRTTTEFTVTIGKRLSAEGKLIQYDDMLDHPSTVGPQKSNTTEHVAIIYSSSSSEQFGNPQTTHSPLLDTTEKLQFSPGLQASPRWNRTKFDASAPEKEYVATDMESFLKFFASKIHFILAFLILLSISLLANLAFCIQFICKHACQPNLSESHRSVNKYDHYPEGINAIYHSQSLSRQNWTTQNGYINQAHPSVMHTPNGRLRQSRSYQFEKYTGQFTQEQLEPMYKCYRFPGGCSSVSPHITCANQNGYIGSYRCNEVSATQDSQSIHSPDDRLSEPPLIMNIPNCMHRSVTLPVTPDQHLPITIKTNMPNAGHYMKRPLSSIESPKLSAGNPQHMIPVIYWKPNLRGTNHLEVVNSNERAYSARLLKRTNPHPMTHQINRRNSGILYPSTENSYHDLLMKPGTQSSFDQSHNRTQSSVDSEESRQDKISTDGDRLKLSKSLMNKADILLKEADCLLT